MAALNNYIRETVTTRSVTYKKEFTWQIENFEDWWSSREITKPERQESGSSTFEEDDLQLEIPKDWSKCSGSPTMTFEVEGIQHEFKLAILKYDCFDRFDEEHNLMMGISMNYIGPLESIIFKPLFSLHDSGTEFGYSLKAKKLKKGGYTECRVFSNHSLMTNISNILEEGRFLVMCLAQINILSEFSETRNLENNVRSKKTWNQYLLEAFDFSSATSELEQFSDFEIICEDVLESGDKYERRFRCHKLILLLGSKYYRKMLLGNFKENQGTTTVTDVSSDTMAKILQYLYTGEVKKCEIDAKLLLAADKYEMEHLHSVCELEIGTRLTFETASEIARVADACGSEIFKTYVYNFVRKHWKQMNFSDQAEWIRNNPTVLAELLDRS